MILIYAGKSLLPGIAKLLVLSRTGPGAGPRCELEGVLALGVPVAARDRWTPVPRANCPKTSILRAARYVLRSLQAIRQGSEPTP